MSCDVARMERGLSALCTVTSTSFLTYCTWVYGVLEKMLQNWLLQLNNPNQNGNNVLANSTSWKCSLETIRLVPISPYNSCEPLPRSRVQTRLLSAADNWVTQANYCRPFLSYWYSTVYVHCKIWTKITPRIIPNSTVLYSDVTPCRTMTHLWRPHAIPNHTKPNHTT